jgi:hypothetical protein
MADTRTQAERWVDEQCLSCWAHRANPESAANHECGLRDAAKRLQQAIEDALRYADNMQHTNEWVVMKMKHVLECARDGKPRP